MKSSKYQSFYDMQAFFVGRIQLSNRLYPKYGILYELTHCVSSNIPFYIMCTRYFTIVGNCSFQIYLDKESCSHVKRSTSSKSIKTKLFRDLYLKLSNAGLYSIYIILLNLIVKVIKLNRE